MKYKERRLVKTEREDNCGKPEQAAWNIMVDILSGKDRLEEDGEQKVKVRGRIENVLRLGLEPLLVERLIGLCLFNFHSTSPSLQLTLTSLPISLLHLFLPPILPSFHRFNYLEFTGLDLSTDCAYIISQNPIKIHHYLLLHKRVAN